MEMKYLQSGLPPGQSDSNKQRVLLKAAQKGNIHNLHSLHPQH